MQKSLVIATLALASLHLVPSTNPAHEDRVAELVTRVDQLESTMMSRDHLTLLSAAWVLDRMELTFLERAGEIENPENPEIAKLRRHVREMMQHGSGILSAMQTVLERDRILLALENYHAAVELRSDVYHRIRIIKEEVIEDGPHAEERRRRREAGVKKFTDYMLRTPNPEQVKARLKK